MRVALPLLALAVLAAAAGAPPAQAVPEAQAGSIPGVEAAWHEPEEVQPHTQWRGYLRLRDGGNVTAASFQVCRVGAACFAPPAPAERMDGRTFRFDTASYLANGEPVDYLPGWELGVKWHLRTADGGGGDGDWAVPAPCPPAAPASCLADEYLTFRVAGSAAQGTPALWAAAPLALLLAALAWRRAVG